MKNNKFTPGPWKLFNGTREDVGMGQVRKADRFYGILAESYVFKLPVAELHFGNVNANAALISAAPEMYEALCMLEYSHDAETQTKFFTKMHQALKKARGES